MSLSSNSTWRLREWAEWINISVGKSIFVKAKRRGFCEVFNFRELFKALKSSEGFKAQKAAPSLPWWIFHYFRPWSFPGSLLETDFDLSSRHNEGNSLSLANYNITKTISREMSERWRLSFYLWLGFFHPTFPFNLSSLHHHLIHPALDFKETNSAENLFSSNFNQGSSPWRHSPFKRWLNSWIEAQTAVKIVTTEDVQPWTSIKVKKVATLIGDLHLLRW